MLLFVLLVTAVIVHATPYDRYRFVDRAGQNFLFRGNDIVGNGQLLYDQLITGIKWAANQSQIKDFPDKFFVVDYCLLEIELSDWETEEQFFTNNTSLGTFVHDPILGALSNPLWFPDSVRQVMAEDMAGLDNLPRTIAHLVSLLQTNSTLPTVIYLHCEAGKDRTGETAGAYYISQLGISLNQALYYDNKCVEGSRDIEIFSQWGLEWYCWYLKYSDAKFSNLDCVPDPTFIGSC